MGGGRSTRETGDGRVIHLKTILELKVFCFEKKSASFAFEKQHSHSVGFLASDWMVRRSVWNCGDGDDDETKTTIAMVFMMRDVVNYALC